MQKRESCKIKSSNYFFINLLEFYLIYYFKYVISYKVSSLNDKEKMKVVKMLTFAFPFERSIKI